MTNTKLKEIKASNTTTLDHADLPPMRQIGGVTEII